MADDTEHSAPVPASGPASRPPERQARLDGVYARADVLRRRRAGWLGIGTGAVALVVIVGMLAVVPDRKTDGVLTAELADDATLGSVPEPTTAPIPSEPTDTDIAPGPGSSGTTETSQTTFVRQSTTVPDDRSTTTTTASSSSSTTSETSAPEQTQTTAQPENQAATIEIVSVTPASPKTGEAVTVQVRVVDPDTELVNCGESWGDSSDSAMPPTQCPTPSCTGDETEEPPSGSTDRIDTFTHTYTSAGTYEFGVAYQGGECTTYWDSGDISSQISVR